MLASSKQQGFTLIELLIAMSISAIIAVISYQSISEVTAIKENTEQQVEYFEKLQRTIWWLEQDFTQLAPRAIQDELGARLPAYLTSPEGIEFTRIAIYPSPYGISGLVRIGYQLDDGTLYRLIWPVIDRAPDTVPKRLAVLTDVEEFSIKSLNTKNIWILNWPEIGTSSKISLPRLIEINIKLKNDVSVRRIFPGVEGL